MTLTNMTRQEYDAAEAYSISNRRTVIRLFQTDRAVEAYTQHMTDVLAVPMTFDAFCEAFTRHIARSHENLLNERAHTRLVQETY
jgi:hypothetical protein